MFEGQGISLLRQCLYYFSQDFYKLLETEPLHRQILVSNFEQSINLETNL